jgi:hypothetical protein
VRTSPALAWAVAALAALAGCGSDEPPETPAACLAPASAYLGALEAAPREVLLDATTPISSCLVEEQPPGPLQTVARSVIGAATELNRRARQDPGPASIVRLGYLVGAVQEAAASTGGIHEDLVLRLDSAARYAGPGGKPFSAAFERSFGAGWAAGQANG